MRYRGRDNFVIKEWISLFKPLDLWSIASVLEQIAETRKSKANYGATQTSAGALVLIWRIGAYALFSGCCWSSSLSERAIWARERMHSLKEYAGRAKCRVSKA